jgi:serine/threonine-protein kinase HipA
MFALSRRHMPPTEILRLLDMVIFNVLACNTDSHARNYSVMIRGNGVSLAPAYDVMCGEVWEDVTKNLVIGDSNSGEQLQAKHWRWFARESGSVVALKCHQAFRAVDIRGQWNLPRASGDQPLRVPSSRS